MSLLDEFANRNMSSPNKEYEKRKAIFEDLKGLSKSEYEEIFRIIRRHQIAYTENSNGIFFDLQLVNDEVIVDIQNYLQMRQDQLKNENKRTEELEVLGREIKPLKTA